MMTIHSNHAQGKSLRTNSSELFCIYDKEGKKKAWIERGFLSSRWLSKEDAEHGIVILDDGVSYNLSMTQALALRIACADRGQRVRAIISFQIHTNGMRLAVAKLMNKEPSVINFDEEIKSLTQGA